MPATEPTDLDDPAILAFLVPAEPRPDDPVCRLGGTRFQARPLRDYVNAAAARRLLGDVARLQAAPWVRRGHGYTWVYIQDDAAETNNVFNDAGDLLAADRVYSLVGDVVVVRCRSKRSSRG